MTSYITPLLSPKELKKELPLSKKAQSFILNQRNSFKSIEVGSKRLALLVGPCSVHDPDAFIEYATHLNELRKKVSKHFMIVCRAYIEKSRTAAGWKGFLYQPNPLLPPDLSKGLYLSRKLLCTLAEMEIPLALEIVDPLMFYYFDDLMTWGCIGARSSTSLPHRSIASQGSIPFGFKNSLDGSWQSAINAMIVAKNPQVFFGLTPEGAIGSVISNGNRTTHLVLRGGKQSSNYDKKCIEQAYLDLLAHELTPQIIVDASHDNSKKNLELQQQIFSTLIQQKHENNLPITAIMLESFIKKGSQTISPSMDPRISITDPCLDFETTEKMITQGYEVFEGKLVSQSFENKHFAYTPSQASLL